MVGTSFGIWNELVNVKPNEDANGKISAAVQESVAKGAENQGDKHSDLQSATEHLGLIYSPKAIILQMLMLIAH